MKVSSKAHIMQMHKKIAALVAAVAISIPAIATLPALYGGGGESDFEVGIPTSHAASTGGSLDEKREQAYEEACNAFEFEATSIPKWNGTQTNCLTGNTFSVDSPEDFAYALANANGTLTSPQTIDILCDIDMNGQERIFHNMRSWTNVIIRGNGHTIYNYHAESDGYTGICKTAVKVTISNLTFAAACLKAYPATAESYADVGIIPRTDNTVNDLITVSKCRVRDSFFENSHTNESGRQHVGPFAGYTWNLRFEDCQSQRNVVVGTSHVGGFMGEYETAFFTDCSSEDNLVLGFGEHSGAFASCSNTWGEFLRCWSNSTIYGNKNVGGFTSGCDGGGTGTAYTIRRGAVYKDCFASGVVEGNTDLGGFIGFTDIWGAEDYKRPQYINCYSTSMVGMNYNGSNIGSFVGTVRTGTFTNCYAAGEVGSIDTDASSSTSCGGFAGIVNQGEMVIGGVKYILPIFDHCFYDMQTTGMKNKAVGNIGVLSLHRDSTSLYSDEWKGIRGFTTQKMTGLCNLFPSGYTYAAGLYPQLSSMSAHSNILFRAQSAASTATVFCDDWDDITQTGFDTVRDTMRNYSFSSLESFSSNENFSSAHVSGSPNITSISWNTDGNVSPLDRTSPVIELAASPYYSTAVHPGVEWMNVNLTYTDPSTHQSATGSRRVRLIPTSIIEVGGDKRIDVFYDGDDNETQAYDHKEGFATTYLDAKTLQSYIDSSTAHPEAVLSFADIVNQQYADGIITGTMNLPFNSTVTNLAVTASMTDSKTGAPAHIDDLYNKLNGASRFEAQDCGLYNIAYKASLTDGRYLSVGKKLAVVGPWSVVYNYNYTGLLAGENIRPDSIFHIVSNLMSFDGFKFADYDVPPVRDGWGLSYWSLDTEGKQPIDQAWFDAYEKDYGTLNRNIDVYAQWKKLSPPVMADVVLDPRIGSYGDNQTGEKVVLTGVPGDKVIIEAATAPEDWQFLDWTADDLGGGTLERSDTGKWVYTFGEADGALHAEYERIHYTVTWKDGLDGNIVKTEKVAAGGKVKDIPEDEIPHHPGYLYVGYDVEELPESIDEDIEITLTYELILIDMPETGSSVMLMITVASIFCIIASYIGFSYRKRRSLRTFKQDTLSR